MGITVNGPSEYQRRELINLIDLSVNKKQGIIDTAIPSLKLIHRSTITESSHRVFNPCLCVVTQGVKEVFLGRERFEYGPSNFLVASVNLPITGKIIRATAEKPYQCLKIEFTPSQILEVLEDFSMRDKANTVTNRGIFVSFSDSELFDVIIRLMRLLRSPTDIHALAPLYIKEILYRILLGDQAGTLIQSALEGSNTHRIKSGIEIINSNYKNSLKVEEIAENVNMSASSFYRHFKEVTSLSPLQYQKKLRLYEARRLLLSETTDATDVAFRVGYKSSSQFSREYTRLFGSAPIKDIREFRKVIE